MGFYCEGTTGATAPTGMVQSFLHHQLVDASGIDRIDSCLETEHG
jgi:hypothetical protein